ncbi:MAG: hypothetical protein PHE86_01085 [Candidatus Marinimicrobia bacterium]|nr:hypothetical protein [Candidatus Neomarinimicrobiota bacterium]MDD5581611.1 hypothetical protein [Candidatus Neomarinimicrobiota bacterium]
MSKILSDIHKNKVYVQVIVRDNEKGIHEDERTYTINVFLYPDKLKNLRSWPLLGLAIHRIVQR